MEELERMIREKDVALSNAFPVLMRKVYSWMTFALLITAITAYGVSNSPALMSMIFSSKLTFFLLFGAELGLVIWLSARIEKLSLTSATLLFILYSFINGVFLSTIFVVYAPTAITKTFLITAGTFGAMSAYGYFTKQDLTSLGKLFMMGLIGLILAIIVNLFLKSSMMDLVISVIGVIIFVGLTAYDSQKIKQMLAMQPDLSEAAQKISLLGALTLYLDFVNLFLYLLRFFGSKSE